MQPAREAGDGAAGTGRGQPTKNWRDGARRLAAPAIGSLREDHALAYCAAVRGAQSFVDGRTLGWAMSTPQRAAVVARLRLATLQYEK
jgi:hypothetical protein